MPDQLQDVNLPRDPLHVRHVDNTILFEHLYGHLFTREGVRTQFHFSEGALANSLA